MKKYLLLVSCSLMITQTAEALTAKQQLDALKNVFEKEFIKMDVNNDGKIDKEEYLTYQFENFRATVIDAEGFDSIENEAIIPDGTTTVSEKKSEKVELGAISPALQEMAEFELEDFTVDESKTATPKLTKEDVLPDDIDKIQTPEVNLSVSEEESLKNILQEMEPPLVAVDTVTPENSIEDRNSQLSAMMETIQKTLPKKIDDITTWVNITYADGLINYIYQANMDTSNYTAKEKAALADNISNEACLKAYQDMCAKIKPIFIDKGINMQITYQDKKENRLGSCLFNQETCQ